MATGETSAGFRTLAAARETLVVHADFEASAIALGLPRKDAVAALLAGTPASRGRSATAILDLPGRSERLHLRPVRHGGWLSPLWAGRLLGLARPIAELHATEALRRRGAPVPRAVLVAGWRAAPLWGAVLATLQIEGALDGLAWLRAQPSVKAIRDAAESAGRAVRRFHDAGGRHADLHIKNLLVRNGARGVELFVIDLDKARCADPPPARRRMLELMRLYRSLLKQSLFEQVGSDARAAFFAGYADGDAGLANALLEYWPREHRRVARHALGYRGRG